MSKRIIDKVKVQLSLSANMVARIDSLSAELGMDRSQLCAYFIGMQVKQQEAQALAITSVISSLPPAVVDSLKDVVSKVNFGGKETDSPPE